jgi:transposase
VKDAPIRGKHVELVIKKRRFWCAKCRKPFMEPAPGISKRSRTTQRFKSNVTWSSEKFSTLKDVAKASRCSEGYVYKAVYEMLELKQRQFQYPWPKVLGIDEHKFKKTKNRELFFATIFVDHKAKRIFEVVEGRDAETLRIALDKVSGRDEVLIITMDLADHYRQFCRSYFPNARIVADCFHVEKLFSSLLNKKRLNVTGDKRKNPIRTLVLRKRSDLKPYELNALQDWLNQHPHVREVYEYKEAIKRFYNCKGQSRARKIFKNILDKMGNSKQEGVISLRETIIEWRTEILAFHAKKLTNARTEGFNRLAKLLQRKAFGFRTFKFYRLKLLNACR